jgi:HSP20 family protein
MRVMKAAPIVGKVKEDIDRLFDRFFSTPFATEPLFPPFETPTSEVAWMPVFDLSETDKEYVVRLEVPGVHRENLDITLRENVLTITGKREQVQVQDGLESYLWKEREFGRFVRAMRLPSLVAENKIEATYQDGVLLVHLPKVTPTAANKILIK